MLVEIWVKFDANPLRYDWLRVILQSLCYGPFGLYVIPGVVRDTRTRGLMH